MGEDNTFTFDKVNTTKDDYSLEMCSLPISYTDYYTSGFPAMINASNGMYSWWSTIIGIMDTKKMKEIMFEPMPKPRRIKCPMKKNRE